MKLIDYSKLMGSPYHLDNEKQIRILIYKRMKGLTSGEKVLVNKKELNPFYIKGKSNNKISKNEKLGDFIKIFKSIMKERETNQMFESVYFNKNRKIKTIGHIIENISEVNSVDPRFMFLWNYKPDIIFHLYFCKKEVGIFNFKEFKNKYKNFDVSSQKHWKELLLIFETKDNNKIPKLGVVGFEKYLSCIGCNKKNECYVKTIISKMDADDYKSRIINVNRYLMEVA